MGQYFTPIIVHLNKDKRKSFFEAFDAYMANETYKLMDHSWIGNGFMNSILNSLLFDPNEEKRVAWWGDYGNKFSDAIAQNAHLYSTLNGPVKLLFFRKASASKYRNVPSMNDQHAGMRHYVFEGLYQSIRETESTETNVPEYEGKGFVSLSATMRTHELDDTEMLFPDTSYFLVNQTKAVYIDMLNYYYRNVDSDGRCIHPLPLLTAIGNGKGNGDYDGVNTDICGNWALDKVAVLLERESIPPVCTEIRPIFSIH